MDLLIARGRAEKDFGEVGSNRTGWMAFAVVSGCLLLLALLIATSPPRLCYDEHQHQGLTQLVRQLGWKEALLSPEDQSAAGPLYPAIQLAFSPLTGLRAPAIRLVNFICLLLVMLLIAKQVFGSPLRREWIAAASILSVPFLWPATGMALTELPALATFTVFVYLFVGLLNLPDIISVQSCALAGFAGLFLGLSILGRQPYLAVLPVVALMILWQPKKWSLLLVCFAVALSVCCWLFILWGGLAPASYNQLAHSKFSLANGVPAISYAGAATLFLNPRWMKLNDYKVTLSCVIAGGLLACLTREYAAPPARTLLVRIFGDKLALPVGFLIGACLVILGTIWVWNLAKKAWEVRFSPTSIFLLITLFALAVTPIMMTAQFSSRYIVGMLGVLLVVVGIPRNLGKWWIIRMVSGSLVGAACLWTYFR